jgi:hypothetical protein
MINSGGRWKFAPLVTYSLGFAHSYPQILWTVFSKPELEPRDRSLSECQKLAMGFCINSCGFLTPFI